MPEISGITGSEASGTCKRAPCGSEVLKFTAEALLCGRSETFLAILKIGNRTKMNYYKSFDRGHPL